ncbi:PREDICTED: uncharacterized protein LOC104727830 [Camelina sativa]|uniref:Uncharacterized protein LOC104727830 n=1 Tax=Camelina sativa TaxID=90675 RepID=A0ABM0URV3_CAMSA|nr:PREDICTED: uncharacterized protein LOC104727830 [Camelina sativa]
MAYTNMMAVAVTAVLFLAVTIAPQWTEAKKPPKTTDTSATVCPFAIPEIVQNCYATMSVLPSEECCKDLRTASKTEVTCLCDNIIVHPNPLYANITKVYFNQVSIACGVLDKYACNGGDANGGVTNKIAASMALFGLVGK